MERLHAENQTEVSCPFILVCVCVCVCVCVFVCVNVLVC